LTRKAETDTLKDKGSSKSVGALIRKKSFGDEKASSSKFFVTISPDAAQTVGFRGPLFWHHTRQLKVFEKGKKQRVVGTVVIGDLNNRTQDKSFENCKQESICFTITNWSVPSEVDYVDTLAVVQSYCAFIQRESNSNECAAMIHSVLCERDALPGTFARVKALLKTNGIGIEGFLPYKQLSKF